MDRRKGVETQPPRLAEGDHPGGRSGADCPQCPASSCHRSPGTTQEKCRRYHRKASDFPLQISRRDPSSGGPGSPQRRPLRAGRTRTGPRIQPALGDLLRGLGAVRGHGRRNGEQSQRLLPLAPSPALPLHCGYDPGLAGSCHGGRCPAAGWKSLSSDFPCRGGRQLYPAGHPRPGPAHRPRPGNFRGLRPGTGTPDRGKALP